MWLLPLITVSIAIRLNGAKKYHINEDSIPRYVIPHPEERQRSAFLPEAVVKKSGSIVGTELPGAYGEDFELESAFESGSGASGSGSSGDKADVIFVARSGEDLETAGKFGNNDVSVANNPVTAFTSEEDDEDVEAEKSQADSKSKKTKASKTDNSAPTVKDATEKQAKTSKSEETKKTAKVEKSEKTKKHKSSTKKTKAKAKSNVSPSSDENNMISKIDAIARQIERVEHKEKLDRKEEATLKVAKKVAKKVIKDIAAKKQKAKIVKEVSKMIEKPEVKPAPSTRKENTAAPEVKVQDPNDQGESPGDEASEMKERALYIQNLKKSEEKPKNKSVEENTKAPEVKKEVEKPTEKKQESLKEDKLQNSTDKSTILEFECPWACYWQCHSYCPSQCCHNPLKCDYECKEYCGAKCSDVCCAPGVQRMATYLADPLTQKDEISNSTNATTPIVEKNKERKKVGKTASTVKANSAENAYEQEKEQQDDIAFISQLEALRKATHYAADLMGLPPDCPDACVQICLPGFCAPHCCTKSILPNTLLNHIYQGKPGTSPAVQPNAIPGSSTAQHFPLGYPLRRVTQREIINAQRKRMLAMQHSSQQKAALKRLALQRKLRGRNLSPAVARFNTLAIINRRKMLLKRSQARAYQYAKAYCRYPRNCRPNLVPPVTHTCSKICRLSCIPQCPNECCTFSSKTMKASKKKTIPHASKKKSISHAKHRSHAH